MYLNFNNKKLGLQTSDKNVAIHILILATDTGYVNVTELEHHTNSKTFCHHNPVKYDILSLCT